MSPEIDAGDPGKQRCTCTGLEGRDSGMERKPGCNCCDAGTGVAGHPSPTASPFGQLAGIRQATWGVFPRLGSGPCACMPANSCRMPDCDWPPSYMLPLAAAAISSSPVSTLGLGLDSIVARSLFDSDQVDSAPAHVKQEPHPNIHDVLLGQHPSRRVFRGGVIGSGRRSRVSTD